MATDAEKGEAILRSLITKCTTEDNGHAWRRCRSCLALAELESRSGRRLVEAFIKEYDDSKNWKERR